MELRKILAAVFEEFMEFVAPAEKTEFISDSDLDGGPLNAVRQLTWLAALDRASRSCGDGPWSTSGNSPAPATDCQRRTVASQQVSVGGEDRQLAEAFEAAGFDESTLRMGLENLDALQDALGDVDGFSSWMDTFGNDLVEAVLAGTRTETIGDRVLVTSYSRRTGGGPLDIRVSTHFRRRPGAGRVVASEQRSFPVKTFATANTATDVGTRHGEHAAEPPPHTLTDVAFELVRLDERTPDGRLIHGEGFGVRELPLSFSAMFTTAHGMPGTAEIVGSIDEVTVEANGRVWGLGWLLDEPTARRAGRLLQAGALRGNSVELSAAKVSLSMDEDDRLLQDYHEAKFVATTLVANPAMEDCTVALLDPDFDFGGDDSELSEIVEEMAHFTEKAPAVFTTIEAPVDAPPLEWFEDPEFLTPTSLSVRDGRVSGHLALWNQPHLGNRMGAPHSQSDYAYFATGEVQTDKGLVATGRLVIGGDHPTLQAGWQKALDYYAATSLAWADVAIGEDRHGIWVSGMVRPGVDPDVLHAARASAVSGDWRRIAGHLELVAILSVNTPGFPVPRGFQQDGRAWAMNGLGNRAAVSQALIDQLRSSPMDRFEGFEEIATLARKAISKDIAAGLQAEMVDEAQTIIRQL